MVTVDGPESIFGRRRTDEGSDESNVSASYVEMAVWNSIDKFKNVHYIL